MARLTLLNKKPLKINWLTRVFVPLTIPFSNSFYQNLKDIFGLKQLLYDQGLADNSGLPLIKSKGSSDLVLPKGH